MLWGWGLSLSPKDHILSWALWGHFSSRASLSWMFLLAKGSCPSQGTKGPPRLWERVDDVGGCSRGAGGSGLGVRGPDWCCGGVEGMWGRLGGCSGCESGTPLRGRARFQSTLCPKMLLWHNSFWPFALPEGSLMHQCKFLNWVI